MLFSQPLPKPVSDEQFEVYKAYYDYDQTELHAEVVSSTENNKGWILEKVTFDAAYDEERVIVYLFLPSKAKPPYQTVIYGPGSAVSLQESSDDIENYFEFPAFLSFVVQSGRAVIFPILKGTFERRDDTSAIILYGDTTHQFTSFISKVVKDYRKCLDYLETRNDIDMAKIAFYGMSWGPRVGTYLTAVEPRIKINVFYAGGLVSLGRPEANEAHFAPRVKIPTLMINGQFDSIFRLENEVMNLYNLLGTLEADKKLVLFDSDHLAPREDLVRETLAWLDQYFGQIINIGEIQRL